ncbi:uncharacterized protein LOC119413846 [Nematolebias whitei]|uniref:uncharacterized protein LOC119413846 n=1 Tax=Nematolebias whitei TaxID=451745 RepID=UPI0018999C0C|nr:uncharacterized protein LOC119413846 [Nematolebias whitei]
MSRGTSVLSVLVLTGTLRLSAGNPVSAVNGAEDVYETKEHSNVSLTWTFMVPSDQPHNFLLIDLLAVKPLRRIYLYDSTEAEPYTDVSYRGRLQCDVQLARGRIECLLKDLRLSDAGTFQWVVVADGKSRHRKCELRVTKSMHQTHEENPNPAGRGRIGFYCGSVSSTIQQVTSVKLLLETVGLVSSEKQQLLVLENQLQQPGVNSSTGC